MSAAECTCACHQGGATFCESQVACCSVAEVAHDAPVVCPYCKNLVAALALHILECTGCRHLTLPGREALRATIAAAHAARR